MSSASWALQQAIFSALANDAALKTLAGDPPRIYDAPPRAAAFPYIVIAQDDVAAWNTASDTGREHALVLHVWSRAGGRKECKQIAEAVCDCLDDAALTLSGHALVALCFQKATFGRETDGKTFRAKLDFRAVTEPQD